MADGSKYYNTNQPQPALRSQEACQRSESEQRSISAGFVVAVTQQLFIQNKPRTTKKKQFDVSGRLFSQQLNLKLSFTLSRARDRVQLSGVELIDLFFILFYVFIAGKMKLETAEIKIRLCALHIQPLVKTMFCLPLTAVETTSSRKLYNTNMLQNYQPGIHCENK